MTPLAHELTRRAASCGLTAADKAFARSLAVEMRRAPRHYDHMTRATAALRIITRRVLLDPRGVATGAVQPEAFG